MELTTEEKIINAARKIFTQKGFSATRTREIAEEAGINLALVNYYFKTKKNLFHLIFEEKFEELFGMITPILSDTEISLEEKIMSLVSNYTNLLLTNEDLSFFVLNEMRFNKYVLNKVIKNTRILSQPIIESQLRERNYTISTPQFYYECY